ncbi:hypothetical protein B0H12DRAFT_1223260 [Mycena haematopus]|nr:hypothetical protein B0H12DRAFT_1223260 [Mycena haematopus]
MIIRRSSLLAIYALSWDSWHVQTCISTVSNRTIDDFYGDLVTGAVPSYEPSGVWHAAVNNNCTTSFVQPDPGQAFDSTWHDTTSQNSSDPYSVTLQFTVRFRGCGFSPPKSSKYLKAMPFKPFPSRSVCLKLGGFKLASSLLSRSWDLSKLRACIFESAHAGLSSIFILSDISLRPAFNASWTVIAGYIDLEIYLFALFFVFCIAILEWNLYKDTSHLCSLSKGHVEGN